MPHPATILIDGRRYRWRDLVQLRKAQRAAAKQAEQLTLFADLPDDRRPTYERTAAGRYRQPSLFAALEARPKPQVFLAPFRARSTIVSTL